MKHLELGDGGTQFLSARLSLNNLRECGISASDVPNCKFGIKITQKNHDFEYGTHYYYQIEVIVDGQFKDIEINGAQISYLIDYRYTLYRSYGQYYHIFKIEGVDKNNNPFEIELESIYGSTYIHSIIFAFIFIAEICDIKEITEIWEFLFDSKSIEIGKSITLLNKSVQISKSLISKYPFMEQLFKAQLDKRVNIIKQELEKITILR